MTRLSLRHRYGDNPDRSEQHGVFMALKVPPTSNTSNIISKDASIMYQLPAVIMRGEYRGLEVILHTKIGGSLIDSLDGSINPLLRVSGLLVRERNQHTSPDHVFSFIASEAHDWLDCIEYDSRTGT